MTKAESRVVQLQKDLMRLGMFNAVRALNWMILTMNANNGYIRKDGSHYYYHLVDSTQDLINHGVNDEVTITACILHDSVEDIDGVNIEYIQEHFGLQVASVVDIVTKKKEVNYKDETGENISNYLNLILQNPRASLVKIADRKHNFSTMYDCSDSHEKYQVQETKIHFIPFAKKARSLYPEYSAYFHSFKTTVVPHLMRIEKAIERENKLKNQIEVLRNSLELEKAKNTKLENKIRKGRM